MLGMVGTRGVHLGPLVMLQIVQLDLPDVGAGHVGVATRVQLLRRDVRRIRSVLLTRVGDQVLNLEHLVSLAALSQVRLPPGLVERVCVAGAPPILLLVLLLHLGHLAPRGRSVRARCRRHISNRGGEPHRRLAVRAAAHREEVIDLLLL